MDLRQASVRNKRPSEKAKEMEKNTRKSKKTKQVESLALQIEQLFPNPEQGSFSFDQADDKSVAELPTPNYFCPKSANTLLESITKPHHAREVFGYAVNARVSVKQLGDDYKKIQSLVEQLRLRDDEENRRIQAKSKLNYAMEILKRRFANKKPVIMRSDGRVANSQGQFEMNSQNMMFDEEGFCCEMGDCPSFSSGQVPTIKCSSCDNWFHFDCLKLNDQAKLDLLVKEDNPFICRKCIDANPKQGGQFKLFNPDDEKDSATAKFVQERVSDCRLSPEGVVEFKLHWLDTETEKEVLEPITWLTFEKVKYGVLEDYYEIISENVEKFDAVHDEVIPATPKEITACRVLVHSSLPNKRIPVYRVDWANQRNDVEDWRPTWDLNWALIAEYHLNKEGISETEEEVGNSHPHLAPD
jgi:hypothetical protein